MKQYCALCKNLINKRNKSLAHFIPQSIGGTLKSFYVLCNACNSIANEQFDRKIYDNFKHFAIILNTYRERGKHSAISIISNEGEKLLIKPDGIVTRENWLIRMGKDFKIYFEDTKELKKTLKKFFSRFKYNLSEIENTNNTEISKDSYFHFKIPFFTGDINAQKGIVLIAYLFYLEEKQDLKYVDKIAEFINGLYPGNIIFSHPLKSISPAEITDKNIFHSILLIGDTQKKQLVCIVELFSTFRYKIYLNFNYTGPEIYLHKSINVLTGKQIENPEKFNLDDFIIPKLDEEKLHNLFIIEFKKLRKIINRKLLKKLIGKKLLFDIENIQAGTIISESTIEQLDENSNFTIFQSEERQ